MSEAASLQLKRLSVHSGLIRQQVVNGLFNQLKAGKSTADRALKDVASACLDSSFQDVVSGGVHGLLDLVNNQRCSPEDALHLILSALDAAGPHTANLLTDGVVRLFISSLSSGSLQGGKWIQHPLILAFQANPAASLQLLPAVVQLLAASAASKSAATDFPILWAQLQPFCGFVMLPQCQAGGTTGGAATASRQLLAASVLHADLARLAASQPVPQRHICRFLIDHLRCYNYRELVTRTWVLEALADVADVVEAGLFFEEEAGQGGRGGGYNALAGVEELVESVVHIAVEVHEEGQTLQPALETLQRLQDLHPPVLSPHLSPLCLLLLQSPSSADRCRISSLIGKLLGQLQILAGNCSEAALQMLLYPTVQTLALGSEEKTKGWAKHLVGRVKALQISSAPPPLPTVARPRFTLPPSGDLCLISQAEDLLAAFLGPPLGPPTSALKPPWLPPVLYGDVGAVRWLHSLRHALIHQQRKGREAGANPFSVEVMGPVDLAASLQVHPSCCMVVAALLGHPFSSVRTAAAEAAQQLVAMSPPAGIALLPLVLFHLQRSIATSSKSASQADLDRSTGSANGVDTAVLGSRSDAVVGGAVQGVLGDKLAMLRVLPAMGGDAVVQPFALRALQPLMATGSPETLQCLGLRLLADMWVGSGRGWVRLEAALNGLALADTSLPLPLRITRAALVREVCTCPRGRSSGRGVELVAALQQSMKDEEPLVVALGLQAIGSLCQEDSLDFYKAWMVVHRWHPTLPTGTPLLAASWVELLAHGHLDAAAYPERAVAIIEMLWMACRHTDWQVRRAAYQSLSQYPHSTIEVLEVQRPLKEYVDLLLEETDAAARVSCEELVLRALEHEHSQRRRFLTASGGAVATGRAGGAGASREEASLRHRLHNTIPSLLAPQSSPGAPPPPCPIAALLCHRPAPAETASSTPSAASSTTSSGKPSRPETREAGAGASRGGRGRGAAAGLEEVFGALLTDAVSRGSVGRWTHPHMVIHAFARFFTRWGQTSGAGGVKAASQRLWALWEAGGAAEAEILPLAAAGLCRAAEGDEKLLTATARKLQEPVSHGRSSAAARAAASSLAAVAQLLHPTDWSGRRSAVSALSAQLLSSCSGELRAACAEGLCDVVCPLAADVAVIHRDSPQQQLVHQVLSLLLSTLCVLCPQLSAFIIDTIPAALPPSFTPPLLDTSTTSPLPNPSEDAHLIPAVLSSLTQLLLALNRCIPIAPALRTWWDLMLQDVAAAAGAAASAQHPNGSLGPTKLAELDGSCLSLPTLTMTCLKLQVLQEDDLSRTFEVLLSLASSEGIDAELHGSAQAAVGQLLRGAMAAGVQLDLHGGVSRLMATLMTESKLVNTSARRGGAAAGLAALMGADVDGKAGSQSSGWPLWSLATSPEHLSLARQALKALEAAALKSTDTRIRSPAAMLLACVCDSLARQTGGGSHSSAPGAPEGGGGGASSGAVRPLGVYPEDGAVRPLVEVVLASTERSEPAALAAVVRCLGSCPRLPAADWAGACRRLLRSASSTRDKEAGEQLAAATLKLACTHGHVTTLGMGVLLDDLVSLGTFRSLGLPLQEQLLGSLVDVVASLAASRVQPVLASLRALLPPPSSPSFTPLLLATWRGLTAAAQEAAAKSEPMNRKEAVQALHAAVTDLYAVMQPLPYLLPGEVLLLASSATVSVTQTSDQADQADQNDSQAAANVRVHAAQLGAADAAIHQAWGAMLRCLYALPVDVVVELTETTQPSSNALRASQTRAMLVLAGRLSFRELQAGRAFVIDHADASTTGRVALMSALAAQQAPQSAQVQILLETMRTAQVTQHPDQAILVAAALVASWESNVAAAATVTNSHWSLLSLQSALASLPFSLPSLLSQKNWRPAVATIADKLLDVLSTVKLSSYVKRQVLASLVSIRSELDSRAWGQISALVACSKFREL